MDFCWGAVELDSTSAAPTRREHVALALSTALAGGLFVALLLTTYASPRALPWVVVLPVIALLYAVANRTQYLRPTANGTTLLYSPTAPFLLAGAVLLPPVPAARPGARDDPAAQPAPLEQPQPARSAR